MMIHRTDITRMLGGFAAAAAFAIAIGAVTTTASAQAERTAVKAGTPVLDPKTVSREARKSYADFWKELPKDKAEALERELEGLETRARRGDDVSRDVERLRREQPQLFEMAPLLQSTRWHITSTGGTVQASCTGLFWIGRNGRPRCLGRWTT